MQESLWRNLYARISVEEFLCRDLCGGISMLEFLWRNLYAWIPVEESLCMEFSAKSAHAAAPQRGVGAYK